MEDKKYPIELEVITPLSVGAGNDNEWMRGIDFVQKDGKVFVLDIQKAAEQSVDIGRLTSLFLNYDEKGICTLIGDKLELVSRYIFKSPVLTNNSIKTFQRTQLYGKPVVAGSSLKGSVRSALFNHLRDKEKTNEEVFGNMKDGTDFMRFIRIADIEMPSTALINTKLFNLRKDGSEWGGGWKHGMSETTSQYKSNGFNTLYESVLPGNKGLGAIILAGGAYELMAKNTDKPISHAQEKKELLSGGIKGLFHVINLVTKDYLSKEKAFFEKYPAERSEELIDNVNALLDMIPADDSYCLLKMSAGVGFHSITGDWQYDDYSQTGLWNDGKNAGKKKYKSRKTAEYGGHLQLMGFVKIRALSVDEVTKEMDSLTEEHAEIIDSIVAPARQREEELRIKREAELARKQAAEAEKQKMATYQDLIEQAKTLYRDNQWNEALDKATAAVEICPDMSEASSLIGECKKAIEIKAYRQSEESATAQKFSQPLAEVIKGKTSAGNLIGTTAKWLKTEGNSYGEAEFQALVNEAKKLSEKEQKNLKGKSKDLVKSIGEERVKKFLEELQK